MAGVLCSMVGASFTVAATGRTAKTFTVFNQAQIDTAQSQFGGASYLGDGTGDYIVSSTDNDLQFTGNFTVELWVRLASTGAIRVPIGNRFSGTGAGIWWVEIGTDQAAYSAWQNTAGTNYYPVMPGTISTNTWTHLAVVRNGSTLTMYKDGVGGTAVTGVTGTFGATTVGIMVGGISASFNWNGHIDEVRISNSARYTANFTPSTSAFVNDTNTVLLLHMNGTDASTTFTDDNGVRNQSSVIAHQTAVSTAQSQFGGASYYQDGTGGTGGATSRLQIFSNGTGTGNYTIEFWIRFAALPSTAVAGYMMALTSGGSYIMFKNSGVEIAIPNGVNATFGNGTVAINTWYHFAFVRSGGGYKTYWNGSEISITSDFNWANRSTTAQFIDSSGYHLGRFGDNRGVVNGFIDEFRISNSARYTTGFTPSTSPFVNDANTVVLLHMDGTNGSTVFTDDNA